MKKHFRLAALLLALALNFHTSVQAATLVWTNSAGGLWSNATNWSPNVVPGAADSAVVTNTGTYTITSSGAVTVADLTLGATNTAGSPTLLVSAGTFTVTNTTVASNGVIFLNAGTIVSAGPAQIIGAFNQASGTWQLKTIANVNVYNFTNGEQRGGTLTVTNFNWIKGDLNADANGDKLIIPTNGVVNFPGAATRNLSYYAPATRGRDVDNLGVWNWGGDSLLYGVGPAVVNNYGTVTVTNSGVAQYTYYPGYASPVWNNFSTFNKAAGAGTFYFNNVILNNYATLAAQAGVFSIYNSTFANSGSLSINGAQLQFYNTTGTNSVNIFLGGATTLTVDNGSALTFAPSSYLSAPGANTVQINSGSLALASVNVTTPALWINGGTLYQRTNIVVNTINESAGGVLQLEVPCFLSQLNQTNGEVRGRSLTVTNWNWFAGDQNRGYPGGTTNDDRTIIPAGGVMNLLGTAQRTLSFYTLASGPGRTIDNFGAINWSGDAIIAGYGVVNNYGTTTVSGAGQSQFYWNGANTQLIWNNYGTFTRNAGTVFYFNNSLLLNSGLMDIQQGTLSIYNSAIFTNTTGVVNVGASAIFQSEASGVMTLGAASRVIAPTLDSIRFGGATAAIETTNIVSPSIWLQAGTLYQRTNIAVSTINESGSSFLQLEVPCFLNQLNETNGNVHGRTLTVTNWNWIAGDHNRSWPGGPTNEEKTIVPPGGVLNLLGAATRSLSFYTAAGPGRGLDNFGTINWSGSAVLTGYGVVNNYGTTTVSAVGTPQFYWNGANTQMTWNNFGTFTRSAGTLFYFNNSLLLNSGLMDIQQGTLSIYNSAIFTNLSSGSILTQPGAVWANDASANSYFDAGSSIACASTNAFQINSGTVTLRSPSVTAPSLWINGGVLNQNTNIATPVINESAGTWQLNVPVSLATYNFTNGELRGGNLTVNNFNWLGGVLYASGANTNLVTVSSQLNIDNAAAKTLSYLAAPPGRNLINNGTATWGGAGITGQGGATILNNGSLNLTNDVGLVWGGSGNVPVLQNNGTFTKSAGTGVAAFSSTTITNANSFNVNSGGISIGGDFVQTAGSAYLGTNFTVSSNVRILTGPLSGRGSIAGAYYNNGSANPGSSPGYINGNTFTNTAAAFYNVELGGATGAGTNYDQLRFTGPAILDGTLNVSLYNNFALIVSPC